MVQLAALAANGGRRDGAEHLLVSRRFGGTCDPAHVLGGEGDRAGEPAAAPDDEHGLVLQ